MLRTKEKLELKCIMLGTSNAGKTCLVERFKHDRWEPDLAPTVGAAFVAKEFDIQKRKINLGVWDTAGSERFYSMTRHYYRGAEAAIICYDVTDGKSWDKVKFWVREILDICEECVLALVATKVDLVAGPGGASRRAVDEEQVRLYARSIRAKCFETSSKAGHNVMQPFLFVCKEYSTRPRRDSSGQRPLIYRGMPTAASEGGCCG